MLFLFVSLKVLFLVALGCKRSIVSHKDSPAAFSQCVSVCQNHTTGPETHKRRRGDIEISEPCKDKQTEVFTAHFIGCPKNSVLSGLLSALDQFAATKACIQSSRV